MKINANEISKDNLIQNQTHYLYSQLEPFIDFSGNVDQPKEIRGIIYKCLKVNYKEYEQSIKQSNVDESY